MQEDQLQFKDAAGANGVVTREWATMWPDEFRDHFWREVATYRERVDRYYRHEAEEAPDFFPWLKPTDTVAVGSLSRLWLFSRRADHDDTLQIMEAWEDPALSSRELLDAPDHEQRVRSHVGIADDYTLVWERATWDEASCRPATPGRMYVAGRSPGEWGRSLADADQNHLGLAQAFEPLDVRRMDAKKLSELAARLDILDSRDDEARRGLDFEPFLVETFNAHGASVERGKAQAGEQVDLMVSKPFRALVECRWRSEPVGAREIGDLVRKLRRRPAIVSGIYVSMAGFTRTAEVEALDHAAERVVLLFDRGDVNQLVSGTVHLVDLYESRLDDVIRRYPSSETDGSA